jgi:hypothetical protein
MESLPVLINGDDILFRANKEFYEVWKRVVGEVGFTLSLGKNYASEKLLTVNSQLYRYSVQKMKNQKPIHVFTRCHFLNAGLLTGQSKVTGREDAQQAPLWDIANEVVPRAINPERAFKRFMHYHKDQIDIATSRGLFNLFLPHQRGGLGFNFYEDITRSTQEEKKGLYVTHFQRRFATYTTNTYHERIAEGKIPEEMGVGLVKLTKSPTSSVTIEHKPKLILTSIYGPQQRGVVDVRDTTKSFPLLAIARKTGDREQKLAFKKPKKSVLAAFAKEQPSEMRSKKIFTWPFKVMEQKLRDAPAPERNIMDYITTAADWDFD